jgi:hypothetical protein
MGQSYFKKAMPKTTMKNSENKRNSQKKSKNHDISINTPKKAAKERVQREIDDRKRTLQEIRERQLEYGETLPRDLDLFSMTRQFRTRYIEFKKGIKNLGLTPIGYQAKFGVGLSSEKKIMLQMLLQSEKRRIRYQNRRNENNAAAVPTNHNKLLEISNSGEKLKLRGEQLLETYRRVTAEGGTEIKASIESGWNYKTELGWFRKAIKEAINENLNAKKLKSTIQINRHYIQFTDQVENDDDEPIVSGSISGVRRTTTVKYSRKIRSNNFRKSVIAAHGAKCACCNLDVPLLLEAAHIRPVGENGSDHFHNGIPLCPTHHTAFDRFLFTIDPLDRKIIFAKGYTANTLGIYNEKIRHNLSFDDLLYRRILFDETSDSDE